VDWTDGVRGFSQKTDLPEKKVITERNTTSYE